MSITFEIDLNLLISSLELTKLPHERIGKKTTPEIKQKLDILNKYFVGREDALLVKYENNKKDWYSPYKPNTNKNVKFPLNNNVLIGYINGEYDLALYPHYQNKRNDKTRNKWRVRWLGIDVDCHGKDFTLKNMEKLSESCDILVSNCKKFFLFDDPKYIIKERSAHGWHLYIILKRDTSQENALFYRDITFPNINLFFKERHNFIELIEYFPFIQINEKSYGNGLKPLFNKFSNLNKEVEIYELELDNIVKDNHDKYKKYIRNSNEKINFYSQNRLFSINNVTEESRFCELGKIHKNSLEWFLSKYYGGQCIKNVINGIYQCKGRVGHTMRIKVVNMLKSLGYSEEVIIQAFENQRDFDYNKTKKMVKDVMKRNYAPPSCKTTRNIGFCDEKNCSKMKSVFLEYNHSEQIPQEIHGWNELHDKIAELIKSNKRYFLRKTTRSGTTTATIIQSLRLGKKMLMIAPTKRIYDKTLKEALEIGLEGGWFNTLQPLHYRIGSNLEICEKISEYKEIADIFPFFLKSQCSKCDLSGLTEKWKYNKLDQELELEIKRTGKPKCYFQKVLNELDAFNIIYLSTQKFKVLINASKHSKEARKILNELISWCDLIFFDECYHLLSVNFKEMELFIDDGKNKIDNLLEAKLTIEKLQDIHTESGFLEDFKFFIENLQRKVNNLLTTTQSTSKEISERAYGILKVDNADFVKWYSMMINYFKKTNDINIKQLVNLFLSISAKKIYIQQRISFDGIRRIVLASVDDIPMMTNWINQLDKPFLLTDAIKPPVDLNKLFSGLKEVNINDPMKTAKSQTVVVCQQYDPFYKGLENGREELIKFLKKWAVKKEVFLVTQNIRYTQYVKDILKDERLDSVRDNIKIITYHRNELTIGVKSNLRRTLCIGSSFIPRHSYDYIAKIYKNLGYFSEKYDVQSISNVLENHEARQTFFQTISRTKDPFGKVKNEVFVFGMKGQVIANWFNQLGIAVPRIISEKEYQKKSNLF